MVDAYLARLVDELKRRGVAGRDRARVLAEAEDHLRELGPDEAEAVRRFGAEGPIAAEIAAQLATTRTIRSTHGAFAALAATGGLYLVFMALTTLGGGGPDLFSARHEAIGVLSVVALVLCPQVAFVTGCLAVLRALRLRGAATLPVEELRVIRTRASIAVAAGGLTAVAMAVWIVEYRQSRWLLVLPVLAAAALGVARVSLARSGRPQARSGGVAGDVFDDLGFRMEPWSFAVLFAAVVGLVGFAGGWVAEGDPGSGVVRGAFEGIAVLGCFAFFGRRLALRR
jgi:hypothetical protein